MKKLFLRHLFLTITLILLIVFCLGQYLGATAIEYFFLHEKIEELSPQLRHMTEGLVMGEHKPTQKSDFIIKVYDMNGNEMDEVEKDGDLPMDFSDADIKAGLEPFFNQVLFGEDIADIKKIKGIPSKSIIVGQPLVKDGTVIGCVFLMKPASDFASALNGFYLVYFCTSLLGSLIILMVIGRYIKEARLLEQTRKDYIANISHELRSPIGTISGLSEALCDEMVFEADKKQQYYHIIRNESLRLGNLISDMLELSGLQNGKTVFERKSFNGEDLIKDVENKFGVLADDMGLTFEITGIAKKLPELYSNASRITQVIAILMDNAFKFCGNEGYVKMDADIKDKWVEISIENSGEVIKKEDLPYVFDRFYRSEAVHQNRGSGLGLAIAKEILKNLDEKIWVSSHPGECTRFSFTVKKDR